MAGKNTGSFLYNLYLKHKKAAEPEPASEASDAGLQSAQPETSPEPEAAPDLEASLSPEKRFLKPIYQLYLQLTKGTADNITKEDILSFEDHLLSPILGLPSYSRYEDEAYELLHELSSESESLFAGILQEEAIMRLKSEQVQLESVQPEQESAQEEPFQPLCLDAAVRIKKTPDQMYAILLVIPPYHSDKELTADDIGAALEKFKVTCGIDGGVAQKIVSEKCYMQIFLIAQGQFPIPGKDGELITQVDCGTQVDLQQDNNGVVDFRNLNIIHTVEKDQVICEVIPPTPGIPGVNLSGSPLAAVDGKPVPDPAGKNTVLSQDGSQLLSETDGQILFKNGRFYVEPVFVVRENVDYSVGNIDFPGNVIVYGDVCNGFNIRAGGDVTVHGMIESATVISGGNVSINKGMNGNFSGLIDAKGSVKASFLENCTVYCEGSLRTNSIVACKIFCEDTVYVEGNKGVVIGAVISAFRSVEARIIGSKSRRETIITLGDLPRLLEKKTALQTELKETEEVLKKLNTNITYLVKFRDSLTADKLGILAQIQQQHALYMQQKAELKKSLEVLEEQNRDYSECRVKCNMIFPPTRINIGPEFYMVETLSSRCNVFLGQDGIVMGEL